MATHMNYRDPRYADAAAEILRRHDDFQAEANITSAVRDFLILTGLARSDEIIEENPPSDASGRVVPFSACLRANAICSGEYRDHFMDCSPLSRIPRN